MILVLGFVVANFILLFIALIGALDRQDHHFDGLFFYTKNLSQKYIVKCYT